MEACYEAANSLDDDGLRGAVSYKIGVAVMLTFKREKHEVAKQRQVLGGDVSDIFLENLWNNIGEDAIAIQSRLSAIAHALHARR